MLLLTPTARPDGFTEEPAAPKKQHQSTARRARARRLLSEDQFNELLAVARQTDAEVRFIEDPDLLQRGRRRGRPAPLPPRRAHEAVSAASIRA